MIIYVQFSNASQNEILATFESPQDPTMVPNYGQVEDTDWRYIAFLDPDYLVAIAARQQRDGFLRSIYDPGIMMAQRAVRIATTPEEISYAEGKIVELDLYAEALLGIPDQAGFPQTIIWPTAPTK